MGLPAWLGRLLVFVFFPACICCEDVFGILGENFTFPVKIDEKVVEIIWTKNKDKVAEWEVQNTATYFTSLQDRGLLNEENACLTIFNLEVNDTGTYVLDYFDSRRRNYVLTFILAVLAPPSEPEISCNISGDDLVLNCTAHFQKPLNYAWKFSSTPIIHQTQEVFIPKKDIDASEKAVCFIKFSQMEKSSEIFLTQCFPGDSNHKRGRDGLIAASVLLIALVGLLVFLCIRGRINLGTRKAAQNCLVHHSATSSQAIDYENEKPEADKEVNKEDSTPEGKQMINSDVNQEDISEKDNSSLLAKHADDHGINEGGCGRDHEDSAESGM
ncbi:lymphocyte function-associated antigen 3 isoform 2-T4 [Cariama cristata]